VGLHPGEYDCPVAFPKRYCFLPDFLYEVGVIFCVLEGLKGDSAVCTVAVLGISLMCDDVLWDVTMYLWASSS
jgi:hypothetical protein